jgi:mRNA-degrading endonuclease RelE of RelBE toxin-antitoxin system
MEQLQSGETPGDRVTGIKYQIFKVRLKNSNIQKGKSGGYRVIYYLKTETEIIRKIGFKTSPFRATLQFEC